MNKTQIQQRAHKKYLYPWRSPEGFQDRVWARLPDHRPPWLIKWFLYENELRAFWAVVKKTILSRAITVQAWERASTSSVGKYKCFDRVPHRIPQQRAGYQYS